MMAHATTLQPLGEHSRLTSPRAAPRTLAQCLGRRRARRDALLIAAQRFELTQLRAEIRRLSDRLQRYMEALGHARS